MLEILALIYFGKKIGSAAEEKGYGGILFILLFVGCWFVGEFVGCFLGLALYHSMGMAYFLGIVSAIVGGVIAFIVVAVLPDTTEDRFDSHGRHVVPKKRRKRRPRPVEDDSYREKFQPRQEKLDELDVIDDYEVEILEEEVKKPPPRKPLSQPPVRKPAADADPSRSKTPERKPPARPPQRKPSSNPNRDGSRPPER